MLLGKKEGTGRRGRRRKLLLENLKEKRIREHEKESTRLHYVGNYVWKRL
jgi:hypothetical protein